MRLPPATLDLLILDAVFLNLNTLKQAVVVFRVDFASVDNLAEEFLVDAI